ncbi:patatin-like protein [Saccharopolyspora rosea]|uniref:Patatin-like protein n=1 Tax=Saccharopolyspora rosea TaxID=524884 RepID=A0ABW3FSM7_9PSEU
MATAAGAENEQELRLALAMRGGTSMAVWIGGAVAEINHLRRALDGDDRHPWAALARLAGYDSVVVDVLAGASAGGLNATLLSAALVYGMPFDRMRQVWVRLADVEAMSRPLPRFWQPSPPSPLEGDGYFRAELERVINEYVPATPGDPARRADLLLTATLLDPVVERHFDGRSGPMLQERREASFRFRHQGRAGDPMSDFGAGAEFGRTVRQLAHAARSTSSFPFAFEPAQVYSAQGEPPTGLPNMLGRFSEVSASPQAPPFRVMDGGVLDNIPVTAAIRAIADAPADRPTHRWLLYLNPDPVASHGQRRGSSLAVPVASSAIRARMTQESLLADLDALEEHNRSVERLALRRRSLFAPLHAAEPGRREAELARLADAAEPDNAVVRAELDAQAVHRLLTEPAGTEDGKLLPPVAGDPLAGWSAQARTQLERRLSDGLAREATARVFDDSRALVSAVQECLSWAWDVERWSDAAEIGRCKSILYRLRTFAEVLEAHADRYWINGAELEPIVEVAELDEWVQRVLRRRDRLQHRLPSPVRPLLGEVLRTVEDGTDFQRELAEFARELLSIVESSGADAAPHDNGGVDAVAQAREVLLRVADRLAAAAPGRPDVEGPEQVGFALLEQAGNRRAEVLRRIVVLTAPLDVGRVPGSRINLLRVVSDEQTPLPFAALRRGDGEPLRIEDKIRGLDLGSFSGFLSAKWRANDWMWGRMDAAAGLVRLFADAGRWVRRHAGSEELGDALQAVVSRPTEGELGELDEQQARQWRAFLAELWARHAADVRAELDAMFADPDGEHPLRETRKLLTERLQWTIAATEIPVVAAVSEGADPAGGDDRPVPAPDRLASEVEGYRVGRQRLGDLGERRVLSIATRLGLLVHRAARPTGRGALRWLARRAMTLVKPLLLAIVYAAAAPTRAALLAYLSVASVTLTGPGPVRASDGPAGLLAAKTYAVSGAGDGVLFGWFGYSPPDRWAVYYSTRDWAPDAVLLLTALLSAVFAVWLGLRVARRLGSGLARWAPGLVVALALLAAQTWIFTTGFRLGPLGLGIVATLLTWPFTVAYRVGARVASVVLTAVVFVAVLALYDHGNVLGLADVAFGSSGWVVAATAVVGYAHMILLGTIDALPPRPRTSAA